MIHLRTLTLDDVPHGLRLKEQAGWNQTAADWQRVLAFEPEGCFLAEWEGQPVGTACTVVLGEVAWITMVLVDPAFQRRGIGKQLTVRALEHLRARGIPTIRLDATPLGRPLYEKLGFEPEYTVVRYDGTAPGGLPPGETVPLDGPLLDEAIALDRQATGTDRSRLLRRLASETPNPLIGLLREGRLVGYHGLRRGTLASHLGPVIAVDAAAGVTLLDAALAQCPAGPVFLDIPLANEPARRWALAQGLSERRRVTRMWQGRRVADQAERIWAGFGPEKG